MSWKNAYVYLRQYKGIQFLQEFHDVEHTLSFWDVTDDLTRICQNDGGILKEKTGQINQNSISPEIEVHLQQELMEYTIQDLIVFLMENCDFSMESAMDQVYSSKTFEKLIDPETGMYLQSSAYVYEYLKEEIADAN